MKKRFAHQNVTTGAEHENLVYTENLRITLHFIWLIWIALLFGCMFLLPPHVKGSHHKNLESWKRVVKVMTEFGSNKKCEHIWKWFLLLDKAKLKYVANTISWNIFSEETTYAIIKHFSPVIYSSLFCINILVSIYKCS